RITGMEILPVSSARLPAKQHSDFKRRENNKKMRYAENERGRRTQRFDGPSLTWSAAESAAQGK
ncbi:MAG: hypothetical protein ACLGIM_17375, partial [Alphaproteobacteria bacterium]